MTKCLFEHLIPDSDLQGAGMAQWRERSPSTNVARVRVPDPASSVWAEFVVGSRPCSEDFSPGTPVFLLPQKSTLLNSNSIWIRGPQVLSIYSFIYWYRFCRTQARTAAGPAENVGKIFPGNWRTSMYPVHDSIESKPHTLFMNLGRKAIPYWVAHPCIGYVWEYPGCVNHTGWTIYHWATVPGDSSVGTSVLSCC